MTIVALSGGKASAWCAGWALRTFEKKDVVLYFTDTRWEHPDLYRFLDDLEIAFDHPITRDSDGRSVEGLFHEEHALANNRMPFCSRVLKAERLQAFYQDGDALVFGIGNDERHRAERITGVYQVVAAKIGKVPMLRFPLIEENVSREEVNAYLASIGVEEPALYKLGFTHNNCSGGCVRSGKKQWKLLYEKLPEVYAERERVEEEMRAETGKDIHYMKDMTLRELRRLIDMQEVLDFGDDDTVTECIGICGLQN